MARPSQAQGEAGSSKGEGGDGSDIDYKIDGKALAVLNPSPHEEVLEEFPHPWWVLHVDGAVNDGGAGTGIVLVSHEGHHLMSANHFKFYATNNDAEYEALINSLKIALEMGMHNLIAKSDSKLVVNQVNGGFQARGPQTELYLRCTQRLMGSFKEVRLECVPREKNSYVDSLAKMGICFVLETQQYIPRTAIKGQALADFLLEFDYEIDGKALAVLHPSPHEEVFEEFPHPWWVLHVDGAVNNRGAGTDIVLVSHEGHHLMSANHFKFYSSNNGAEYEALINGLKITLKMGVHNLITKSDSKLVVNQVNGGFQARGPQIELYLRCTQRLMGSFKEVRLESVPREKTATWMLWQKWDPSRKPCYALATITAKKIKYFMFNSIICRFRIPYKLVSDNEKQFDSKELRQLCEDLNIKKELAAVYHPQSNGQTEAVNKIIKHTLKTKLKERNRN
ncbi:uncharacterized protein LOC141690950 [Apium graveolens]|uniref:uncharacterized protein LOC141690950 n=1 Tax=Apium graveolens TaxID=4045 RepID=UPI003D7B6BAA